MIKLCNISKFFKEHKVLENIDFSISRSDFVFFTGPNEAGKTTLLKLIYKEEIPSSGDIMIFEKFLSELNGNEIQRIRRKIGVIFQDLRLLDKRTVLENLNIVFQIYGKSLNVDSQIINETLLKFNLFNKRNFLVGKLSLSEKQKLTIVRALIHQPEIILADEPFNYLDLTTSAFVMSIFNNLNEKKGTTIIIATHKKDISLNEKIKVININNIEKNERTNI